MNRSLELPEGVYKDLVQAAEASGKTPAGWIQERLPKNGPIGNGAHASDAELAAADATLDASLVSPGHPLRADNEQIDADLAREYAGDRRDDLEDKGFLEYCRTEGDPNITLQEVREALAVIPGSMTAACSAERDED